jgi:hypothetical protein
MHIRILDGGVALCPSQHTTRKQSQSLALWHHPRISIFYVKTLLPHIMVTLAPPNAVFMRWLYAKPKEVGVALAIWLA